nr:macrolide ABC transporter permease/ATP-binding protein MacB [Armatimonadota bacterium]
MSALQQPPLLSPPPSAAPRPKPAAPERPHSLNWAEGVSIAWQGLSANKMRSLLTMLGIIIGVAAVITMIAV